MPASLNKTSHIGNLTKDPVVRYTPKGTAVADFSIAINQRKPDGQGGYADDVLFLDVTVWGNQAESCGKYLTKGRSVFVDGRLAMDTWDDKATGQKRSKLKVIAHDVQFLGDKRDDNQKQETGERRQEETRQPSPDAYQSGDDPDCDDDIPF